MDLIQKMALSKFKLTAADKDAIPAGTHGFDFVVRVKGSLNKAEDTDKDATCSIPLIPTLALLVHRMGITRKDALKLIRNVVTDAINFDVKANEKFLQETGVADAIKLLKQDVISKLPKTSVKGRIDGKPIVELVGIVEETTDIETGEILKRVVS